MGDAFQLWEDLERRAIESSFSGVAADSDDLLDDEEFRSRIIDPNSTGSKGGKTGQSAMPPMMMGGAGGVGKAGASGATGSAGAGLGVAGGGVGAANGAGLGALAAPAALSATAGSMTGQAALTGSGAIGVSGPGLLAGGAGIAGGGSFGPAPVGSITGVVAAGASSVEPVKPDWHSGDRVAPGYSDDGNSTIDSPPEGDSGPAPLPVSDDPPSSAATAPVGLSGNSLPSGEGMGIPAGSGGSIGGGRGTGSGSGGRNTVSTDALRNMSSRWKHSSSQLDDALAVRAPIPYLGYVEPARDSFEDYRDRFEIGTRDASGSFSDISARLHQAAGAYDENEQRGEEMSSHIMEG